MTVPFATASDLAARLPDFDPEDAAAVLSVEGLLEQATDYLVGETGADVVVAPPTGDGTARVFYGTGTAYLSVGDHDGAIVADNVEPPAAYGVPTFADVEGILVLTGAAGDVYPYAYWPLGVPFTITARWGSAAVPGDLKAACLDLAVFWYVQSRVDRPEQMASGDVPASVRRVIERRRYQKGAFA